MKKIMIVDDSTAIRSIIKSGLVSDYEVYEAEHGKDALSKLNYCHADLFLLDVNMPVMDGLALLKEIRGIDHFRKTPVIMLTTETKEERKQEGRDLGATGWIMKPCEPHRLMSAVKKIIGE